MSQSSTTSQQPRLGRGAGFEIPESYREQNHFENRFWTHTYIAFKCNEFIHAHWDEQDVVNKRTAKQSDFFALAESVPFVMGSIRDGTNYKRIKNMMEAAAKIFIGKTPEERAVVPVWGEAVARTQAVKG